MKVFLSWSGDLSKQVAQILKKWVPCIIQSVEIFFSPNDIEKGENWDSKLTSELAECNYGIVCLTTENKTAPWLHFEAGALAKTLDSRVSALMVNITTSDIQGPLSRFQATKLEEADFKQLISDINNATTTPLQSEVLKTAFDAIWEKLLKEINDVISLYPNKAPQKQKVSDLSNNTLEEILQLVRKQDVLLSTPEKLFPLRYINYLRNEINSDDNERQQYFVDDLFSYLSLLLNRIEYAYSDIDLFTLNTIRVDIFLEILKTANRNKKTMFIFRDIIARYNYLYSKIKEKHEFDLLNKEIEIKS